MRGKKPKERKSYVLRMPDGSLIEVTREVYLEWYSPDEKKDTRWKGKRNKGCVV